MATFDEFRVTSGVMPLPATTTRTLAYTYDGLQRLTGATENPGVAYTYGYDKAGNRTQVKVNGTTTETRSYNLANQVVGWGYDKAGNAITVTDTLGTSVYTYDYQDRVQQVRVNGKLSGFYLYNGDGALMTQAGITTTDSISFTQDLASPLSRVLQTRHTSGTVTTYQYGLDVLGRVEGSTRTWYAGDALGSVRQILDTAGQPLMGQTYDPWGVPTGSLDRDAFGYTGEWQDGDAGLVNLRARWYQPRAGRFMARDPFEGIDTLPTSLHPYQYGYNDPILNTDPSGEVCVPTWVPTIGGWGCEDGTDEGEVIAPPSKPVIPLKPPYDYVRPAPPQLPGGGPRLPGVGPVVIVGLCIIALVEWQQWGDEQARSMRPLPGPQPFPNPGPLPNPTPPPSKGEYIYRKGRRNNVKSVAITREQDWVTGLSFGYEKPREEHVKFSVAKLLSAGYVVRPDGGTPVLDVHTGSPLSDAERARLGIRNSNFGGDHVSVYLPDMKRWDAWYQEDMKFKGVQGASPEAQRLFALRELEP